MTQDLDVEVRALRRWVRAQAAGLALLAIACAVLAARLCAPVREVVVRGGAGEARLEIDATAVGRWSSATARADAGSSCGPRPAVRV
jgi:hypothetical protein